MEVLIAIFTIMLILVSGIYIGTVRGFTWLKMRVYNKTHSKRRYGIYIRAEV